ncbi:MAG: hypothetical protein HKN57_12885 [Xanthomonadales bacterium]|nr:hypothetical protein [Gammaproteobacteria bacterium]MBT8054630.1 hypothetical protein [Gammaproteobacteria bacterium]NND58132.1 hypothetical protein [Xanthomonadales bacterium]NNK50405.1 hypothetical protein [Xanthomonadales bacterium]
MSDQFQSILLGTAGLSLAAVVSLLLTFLRGSTSLDHVQKLQRLTLIGLILHSIHFGEETLTGFYEKFPMLLGLAPWPINFFVGFNLSCIALWLLCIPLIKKHSLAIAPIWFLAIASIINLAAHPLLSIATGGYFPGLFSSPVVGILGIVLFRQLISATQNHVL